MNRAAQIIHLDWAHKRNIYGKGIGVAVLDSGLTRHPDFIQNGNRIIAFYDAVNHQKMVYDDNGHGTHVTGILAGDGYCSDGYYCGVAPKCNIISVKVLNQKGNGDLQDVLDGLRWVIKNRIRYNIRIANISVGTTVRVHVDEDSELIKTVNEVWDSGICVVAAAGNGGPEPKSIGSPGISRKIITVGASDDDVLIPLMGKSRKDYSGRGPTDACIKKPDVVAPGSHIKSCKMIKKQYSFMPKSMNYYMEKSGTSMSTPIVAGSIALLLSCNKDMGTRDVKMKLRESCDDLGLPYGKQGWGLLNIEKFLAK